MRRHHRYIMDDLNFGFHPPRTGITIPLLHALPREIRTPTDRITPAVPVLLLLLEGKGLGIIVPHRMHLSSVTIANMMIVDHEDILAVHLHGYEPRLVLQVVDLYERIRLCENET